MQRRAFLRTIGLGTAALAFARRADAHRSPFHPAPMPVLAGVSQGAAPMPGTLLDVRADGSRDFVKPGGDLGARDVHVFAADNAATRFHVWARITPPPKGAWAYLAARNGMFMASSVADDAGGTIAVFDVMRDLANEVASSWSVGWMARRQLDGDLAYEWSNPSAARIRLRVTNRGKETMRFTSGDRFSFRAHANGRDVPLKDGADFGDTAPPARLVSGAHLDVETDLRAWIDTPGVYDVDCTYAGALFMDTDTAGQWPEHAAETWDIAPVGTLRITTA